LLRVIKFFNLLGNPKNDANIQGDPYKTLFIYKLDYKTDERKLKREFEMYGPIKRVKVVRDLEGNSRGYAFIEFEHKSDFKNAYKKADRKRIDENRVSVDYERGRTEKNWKPRRFGGGKGECRVVPAWLEKELNMVKEYYPELMTKYKSFSSAPEETPRKRSRSRNRSQEKDKEKESKGIIVNDENFQNTSCSLIENMNVNMTSHVEVVDSGNFESSITQNMEVDQIQRMNGVSITRDHSNEDHKKHKKDKKEKRDKKEKKEKKEKKSKKDKKERKEKRSDKELEVGEIA
jgi:U1 small nuclear ribonucleoprotein